MIVASLLFLNCCSQQKANATLAEAEKEIIAKNEMYFRAFATGDSSLLISCYTEDCWIMQPNTPALCGTDAPLDFFKFAYHLSGVRKGKFITIDIFGTDGEFLTEVGFWKTLDGNNNVLGDGQFLVLWKKTPDGWKRYRDSFTSIDNK